MAKTIHASDFWQEIRSGTVLTEFFTDGCVPCRRMSPTLAELEESGKLAVYKINIGLNLELAGQLGVQSSPTLILYRDGTEIVRMRGFQPKPKLLAQLQDAGVAL
ncbi:MAG: thioredoxin family protein [Butyricicoccaceae bacterium]